MTVLNYSPEKITTPRRSCRRFIPLLILLCFACGKNDPESANVISGRYLFDLELEESHLLGTVAVDSLGIPWDLAWGPDDHRWFTEQQGTVQRFEPMTGNLTEVLRLRDVHYEKSRGLLSMALHPDFEQFPHVFLHYTYLENNSKDNIRSRLVRYTFRENKLHDPFILLDSIPGETYHNGSRMLFTSRQKLILTTGDAGNPLAAQDETRLNGKTLRINADGSIPADNPIPNSLVYTIGHRNIQGIVQSGEFIYVSEHGPNNDDEINILVPGDNYGWPMIEGLCDAPGEQEYCNFPAIQSLLFTWTPTVAPAGIDFYNSERIPEWQGSLLAGSLIGQSLRVLKVSSDGKKITEERIYLKNAVGRIRDICVSSNGEIYLALSNADWHTEYFPWLYEHLSDRRGKIIRLSPVNEDELNFPGRIRNKQKEYSPGTRDNQVTGNVPGSQLYMIHCASCHQSDGSGVNGLIPPLGRTDWVTGDKSRLIHIVLNGMDSSIVVKGVTYHQEMPAYKNLTDDQLAELLTFIRRNFGNQADMISNDDVRKVREETGK